MIVANAIENLYIKSSPSNRANNIDLPNQKQLVDRWRERREISVRKSNLESFTVFVVHFHFPHGRSHCNYWSPIWMTSINNTLIINCSYSWLRVTTARLMDEINQTFLMQKEEKREWVKFCFVHVQFNPMELFPDTTKVFHH